MRTHSPVALAVLAAALALSMSAVTAAQDSPPGRTAQLSYVSGSVWLEPAGTQNWIAADLNRPVTVGDRLWADRDSRAELDIGDAVIRLASFTGFSFLNLDQLTAQMQVTAGTAIVHVYRMGDGEQDEVDTPNLALSLERPGIYRVEVNESGDTTIVKVIDGRALASGGGKTYTVSTQQSVTFTGTTTLSADYALLGAPDAFDDWSMSRDREEAKAAAAVEQYVSPNVVGASDLAGYGSWQDTQWGYAWFPVVPAGWAPYSLGHWAWIFPWGWTWVDEEPWGFAPFHYGRWGRWNGGWCWVPGPRRVRPVYAPALVAFTRSRIGRTGVRAGSRRARPVGWFPLGPRDVYLPSYAASRAYVRGINLANAGALNATTVDDRYHGRPRRTPYANSRVPGAITAVPRSVFTAGQPVAPHRIVVPRHGATRMRFTSAAPAIAPVKASVLGPHASHVFSPPRRLIDRPVVARRVPSRAPVSFEAQQTAIRANGGRPLSMGQWAHLRPNRPAVPVRLAGAAAREVPGRARTTAPGSGRQPAFERPGVQANRPPWLRDRQSPSGGRVSAPRSQPAFGRPGVPVKRPPRLRAGPGRTGRGAPVPQHQPAFERPAVPDRRPARVQGGTGHSAAPQMPRFEHSRPERIPRFESPPRSMRAPRAPSPPRIRSAPSRAEPHLPSFPPSHPARRAPAPRSPRSQPPPEIRHPPRFQTDFKRPTGPPGWRSAPMYRAQPNPAESVPGTALAIDNKYEPPAAPPPMYRPVRAFAGAMAHREFAPHQIAAPRHASSRPALRPPDHRTVFRH